MRVLPRPFGSVLGDAMTVLGRVWRPLLSTALLVFVPLAAITLIVFNMTGALEFFNVAINDPTSLESLSREELFDLAVPFFWAVGVTLVIQSIASIYVYLVSHLVVAADLAGEAISGLRARREALSRFMSGLVAAIIVFLVIIVLFSLGLAIWLVPFVLVGTPTAASVLVALVLLVAVAAPAIFLSVSFSMVTSVVAIEAKGPLGALRRSFRLVRSRWWPTLGYLLLVGLLGSVAAQLIQVIAIPLTVIGDAVSGFTIASLLGIAFQGLLIAGIGAMYTVWYVDLRARSEQLDAGQLRSKDV